MTTDDFLGSFCIPVQHGLLVLRDINSADTHEGWDGGAVHAVADSLYLRVQPSVDGPVTVEVFDSDEPTHEDVTLYDGIIASQHGEFVLHDPNNWISMRVITDEPGTARLRITGDHDLMPSVVRIQIWY
ncbi:hypothetical protein AB0C02_23850 [Micromonospora sp. NPDC048999]|uniref:hypothetical protein n=1 Tax=Micromonospora sp. NPDC048999 TaxID=3155391 RepID=UPI0033F35914